MGEMYMGPQLGNKLRKSNIPSLILVWDWKYRLQDSGGSAGLLPRDLIPVFQVNTATRAYMVS